MFWCIFRSHALFSIAHFNASYAKGQGGQGHRVIVNAPRKFLGMPLHHAIFKGGTYPYHLMAHVYIKIHGAYPKICLKIKLKIDNVIRCPISDLVLMNSNSSHPKTMKIQVLRGITQDLCKGYLAWRKKTARSPTTDWGPEPRLRSWAKTSLWRDFWTC